MNNSSNNPSTVAAKATFNKLSESKKSALCLIRVSDFQFSGTPAYLPASAVASALDVSLDELEKGMKFEIPAGFYFEPMTDEDGNERKTKDGLNTLMQLAWG